MSAPLRQRGEDVAGCGGECCCGTVAHAFDTKLVGEGKMFELVHEPGNTSGQILREAAEIAENRWQAEPEEECNAAKDTDEQNDNDDWTGEVIAADLPLHHLTHNRYKHDGKKAGDVDDLEDVDKLPAKEQSTDDGDGEEDVSADPLK